MEFFVIRQPIFDRQQHVFAYEILCRSQQSGALQRFAGQPDGTSILSNSFLLIGFNRITRGKKAFIRFSKESLRSGLEFGLPRDLLVIELLEDVEPEETLINACKQSKAEGHLVALGGSACRPACPAAFLGIIDFIKVNFQETNSEDRKAIVDLAAPHGIKVLADGLETRAAFTAALAAGCSYFQGDFFSKPVIISGRDLPRYKLSHLRILHELHRENLDFDALEQVIKQDVTLSYTLLNRVNTAFYGQRQTVSSLHHALSLLGEREIRRWASLVVLNTLGRDQPHELLVTSLVRASFCESLAAPLGLPGKTAGFFLMGLLSLLDVFVGRPMEEIMEDMPLGMEVKSALTGGHNQHRNILDLVLNYEKGDIEQFLLHAAQLRLDETLITDLYLQAIDRAEDALQIYGSRPPPRT